MNKLNRINVSTIFRARSRMLEVKTNYKNKYRDNLKCRACKEAEETQLHVLQECDILHVDETTKIKYDDIFEDEDIPTLRTTAIRIRETIERLNDIKD